MEEMIETDVGEAVVMPPQESEETQEPASISFSYPGGTGNAGESANQQ